jgi:C4-dicarboxylate-specific signal transduction histidine kinase
VNVSAALVVEQMRKSKTASLSRAIQLLGSHKADLPDFLTRDPQGIQLPGFLEALSEHLVAEQMKLIKEMKGLQQNIEHIKHIVATQQHYAKVGGALENIAVQDLVEDALRMSAESLTRHQIEVVRQFEAAPPALLDRHKVLQILINLISNAKQALSSREEGRRIELHILRLDTNFVRLQVTDNGSGIAPENLTRVFQHGFTTKKRGHGFGLHSGANAAVEMGGRLTVHSDGLGHGATFRLDLPISVHTAQAIITPADTIFTKRQRNAA